MSQEKIERWNEVDGNLDNGEKLQAFLDSTTDAYAILQLRRTDECREGDGGRLWDAGWRYQ